MERPSLITTNYYIVIVNKNYAQMNIFWQLYLVHLRTFPVAVINNNREENLMLRLQNETDFCGRFIIKLTTFSAIYRKLVDTQRKHGPGFIS